MTTKINVFVAGRNLCYNTRQEAMKQKEETHLIAHRIEAHKKFARDISRELKPFQTSAVKAQARTTLTNLLVTLMITIFALAWAFDPSRFTEPILIQIVLTIPLLSVGIMSYSKSIYSRVNGVWDFFGWFCNNTGMILTLNVIGLMLHSLGYDYITGLYFGMTLLLQLVYTMINIYYRPNRFFEKSMKFLFFFALIIIGGILPLL